MRSRLGSDTYDKLAQRQRDALVSSWFNAGANSALGPKMVAALKRGDLQAAADQFDAYWGRTTNKNKDGTEYLGEKEKLRGLIRRNLAARAMFKNGRYDYAPSDAEIEAIFQRPEG